MPTQTNVVMDFPTAWNFVHNTEIEDHEELCSYRQTDGALLCDCHVIWDEYDRRADEMGAPRHDA